MLDRRGIHRKWNSVGSSCMENAIHKHFLVSNRIFVSDAIWIRCSKMGEFKNFPLSRHFPNFWHKNRVIEIRFRLKPKSFPQSVENSYGCNIHTQIPFLKLHRMMSARREVKQNQSMHTMQMLANFQASKIVI